MIQANEVMRLKARVLNIFEEATGQSREKLERDMDRDFYLSAEEAVEYGIVDHVVESTNDIRTNKNS